MHTSRHRTGSTLLELVVVIIVAGVLAGLAVPPLRDATARRAAQAAARDLALLLGTARQIAATRLDGAAVVFDTAAAVVQLRAGHRDVRTLDLRAAYGVRLRTTRDSVAYDSRGLGIGAANATLVVERSAAAETLVVSRLGRLRGGP